MKTMQELIPNGAEIAMIMLVMIFFGDIHSLPIVSILCIFWTSMVHHTIDQIKIHMHVINIHYMLRTKTIKQTAQKRRGGLDIGEAVHFTQRCPLPVVRKQMRTGY